jgi:hypothetical protein
MSLDEHFDLAHIDTGKGDVVRVRAGRRDRRRVVPPAGEKYAFTVQEWAREVEVSVSPKGQSVRVFVDGVEVPAPTEERG